MNESGRVKIRGTFWGAEVKKGKFLSLLRFKTYIDLPIWYRYNGCVYISQVKKKGDDGKSKDTRGRERESELKKGSSNVFLLPVILYFGLFLFSLPSSFLPFPISRLFQLFYIYFAYMIYIHL